VVSSAEGSVGESTIAGTTRSVLARKSSLHTHLSPPLIKSIWRLRWRGRVNGQEYLAQTYSVLPHPNYGPYRVNPGFLSVSISLATSLVLPPQRHFIDFVDNQLIPLSSYGVNSMSVGYLDGEEAPVACSGLMVMKAMNQMLNEVE